MADKETRIAWMALRRGHPVTGADGEHVGKVSEIVADQQKDIFSGIAFRHGILDHERFAPADLIDAITSEAVQLRIPAQEAESLEHYEG
ncbi:MAG TPA: hypothetical protein VE712_01315 [Actinomycetota bacterium]|jgi:uncharacterized protein YrrD|nr:hypothetical protein [Actinomycetota bacterium]